MFLASKRCFARYRILRKLRVHDRHTGVVRFPRNLRELLVLEFVFDVKSIDKRDHRYQGVQDRYKDTLV